MPIWHKVVKGAINVTLIIIGVGENRELGTHISHNFKCVPGSGKWLLYVYIYIYRYERIKANGLKLHLECQKCRGHQTILLKPFQDSTQYFRAANKERFPGLNVADLKLVLVEFPKLLEFSSIVQVFDSRRVETLYICIYRYIIKPLDSLLLCTKYSPIYSLLKNNRIMRLIVENFFWSCLHRTRYCYFIYKFFVLSGNYL